MWAKGVVMVTKAARVVVVFSSSREVLPDGSQGGCFGVPVRVLRFSRRDGDTRNQLKVDNALMKSCSVLKAECVVFGRPVVC